MKSIFPQSGMKALTGKEILEIIDEYKRQISELEKIPTIDKIISVINSGKLSVFELQRIMVNSDIALNGEIKIKF